jgi:hypothetical protein
VFAHKIHIDAGLCDTVLIMRRTGLAQLGG